jgi:hypothetical protein
MRYLSALLLSVMLLLLMGCSQQQLQRNAYTPRYVYQEGVTAYVLRDGRAVAPRKAPARIKRVIAAGNKIIRKPYRRGGGHGRHHDSGYDCSGATSFILREAGLLHVKSHPTSSTYLRWGRPGFGKWLTVYTKRGHVFVMVAGIRFDTSGSGRGIGPRWYTTPRRCGGFYVRHIPGY